MHFDAILESEHANVLLEDGGPGASDKVLIFERHRCLIGLRILPILHCTPKTFCAIRHTLQTGDCRCCNGFTCFASSAMRQLHKLMHGNMPGGSCSPIAESSVQLLAMWLALQHGCAACRAISERMHLMDMQTAKRSAT